MYTAKERSAQQMALRGYDPIDALVSAHQQLLKELERQEKIRDGEIVDITSAGKIRAYRPEVHHALFTQIIAIGDKLLRYGYSRVPEVQEIALNPVLEIKLHEG